MTKRLLPTLAMLFILPFNNNCSAQATDSARIVSSLNRCWRAFSHSYATIYGLEDEEIKTYSKQRVCFSRDSVSLYYGVSYSPKYSIKKVNAEDYSKSNFDCSKRTLGIITDSMFEITILSVTRPKGGTPHKMTSVITYDGDCTYTMVDGVVFKLVDADAKTQGRSAN